MNIKSSSLGCLLISILLLASCQSGGFVEEKNTHQPTLESAPTTTPSPSPTATAILPTLGSEPLPLKRQCVTQLDVLPEEDRPAGNLVLAEYSNGVNYFFLDLKSMTLKEFASNNDSLYDLTISPNHTLMLYFNSGSDPWRYEITTLEGEVVWFPHSDEWPAPAWFDNEHLVLGRTGETPDSTIRIYNFLTGENKDLFLDIPNPYYWLHVAGKNILIASVNPDLTRVVFFDMQDGGRIIFWDNEAGKMLASLPYFVSSDPWYIPAVPFFEGWSADGKQFVTTSPIRISDSTSKAVIEELFLFGYDGQIMQLTHLRDAYSYARIFEPAWSPDGESIAFWLQVSDSVVESLDELPEQLMVLNLKTGQITDLCLPYGAPFYSPAAPEPIWSPDSEYLVVETRLPDGKPRINLVNIRENSLFVLQEDLSPVGWVSSP